MKIPADTQTVKEDKASFASTKVNSIKASFVAEELKPNAARLNPSVEYLYQSGVE